MNPTTRTASKLSRRHFIIATIFEGGKYLHQAALYFILPAAEYGLVGSVFSLAYLSANLACLEGNNALVPHTNAISTNANRRQFILRHLIGPQLIQHSLAATATGCTIYQLTQQELLAGAGCLIALTEGLRIACRPLIYAMANSQHTAKNEATISFAYIGILWAITALNEHYLTSTTIVGLYAIASILGLSYLITTGLIKLKKIPKSNEAATLPQWRDIWRLQGSLLALQLPHNLFSANFIVPFFAYRNGLVMAGAIKITSEVAGAVRSVIKSSIGFPLNALFSQIATNQASSGERRQEIFATIQSVATQASAILIVTLSIIGAALAIPWPIHTKVIFGGFCLLMVADYLCMPYELLSLHSNTVGRAALIRGAEVIVDIVVLIICAQWPLGVITGIGIVRLITWQFLARATRPVPFF